jgi:hypothetical protein
MTTRETGSGQDEVEARLDALLASVDVLCGDDEHRREPLLERAESHGLARSRAELVYDVAVQERVPPALALALVAAGLSVQPLRRERSPALSAKPGEPDWVDRPPEPKEAEREWRLRQTLRRLRSLLPASATPRETFTALGKEPDLEPYDY